MLKCDPSCLECSGLHYLNLASNGITTVHGGSHVNRRHYNLRPSAQASLSLDNGRHMTKIATCCVVNGKYVARCVVMIRLMDWKDWIGILNGLI